MTKAKSPFRGYDVQDVFDTEASHFALQLGNDYYSKNGDLVFSKKDVEKHYTTILSKILDAIHSGNEKNRANAIKCLETFRVHKLRIH